MEKFTAKNWDIKTAPAHIKLLGDKTVKPEPAQHIIEFPGGAIEVSRTSEGNYWAHIIVFRDADNSPNFTAGAVIGSRLDTGAHIEKLRDESKIQQIAVLIKRTA